MDGLPVEARDPSLRIPLENLTVLGEFVQVRAFEESLWECTVMCIENVRSDLEPDQFEKLERGHR